MTLNAGHLVDALSASLFALLGIWAAVVRRHWFLRFAVVGGLLALALFVPAYEVVIEFGVAMAFIAMGVGIARRTPAWRARWSMETALLSMVVAAVAAAAVGAAPSYGLRQWIELVGIGFTVSYFALVSLWIVCGSARRRVRVAGGAAAVALYVVVMYVGEGLLYATTRALTPPGSSAIFHQSLATWFNAEYAASWFRRIGPCVAIGVGVLLFVIAAARASGWFSSEAEVASRGVRFAGRAALCLLVAGIVAPNAYLLYRLCTPPAPPHEPPPADNAFDELLAAGATAKPLVWGIGLREEDTWSDAKLFELASRLEPVYRRIDDALGRPSFASTAYADEAAMAPIQEAAASALVAYQLRLAALQRREDYGALAQACCRYMRLGQSLVNGQRADYDMGLLHEAVALGELKQILGALTPDQCRDLAAALVELDATREPHAKRRERQQVYDFRTSWQTHLQHLIAEWSGQPGDSQDDWELQADLYGQAEMRLLAVNAALHGYIRDHGQPPDDLQSLVPGYLADVPRDPWDGEPVRYRREGAAYRIYCVGWDEVDHGGKLEITTAVDDFGDVLRFGPRFPPMRRAVKERLTSGATHAWSWLKAAAAAAEKAARPTTVTAPH